ncbi:glucocorticoid modulatory element-binding protein 2-like [Myxocyprinus asiaticus]|uniref:glucocorticoid modulatory element-binding protein 2-like n=1 Tax=Myxocyprinus asiaticus TaxID=70543 RepID=UPI00222313B5|nr:glucocorticoid modulatory element-binding protein 2-like [Myxocyprinus asiaticus]XP_051518871.1 glucocorticoid modulatory element-binding protein 2-like [Myxocyprinus asiaticus]XP_051518872.1 glucocorticoid modulatory element-binding protein 2-like [Myxocyprinus asiaticus]XP_051518873.1 glucocorticoid modulatory element-binding protein 2-like [Myxocyprinus asiaticus]
MASSSDVNVHMEEVVVVTTPDSAGQTPSSEEKNILVATDLEQSGKNMEQSMESEAESSTSISLPKETVLVKFSEDVEAEILYPITCGDSKANLVWKKFVCPGINIKCVQLNEHLISPKEFVYLAGKSTLKDWKRAIRLNGTMLRKIMDSGELDFYQHSRLCSNTCRSTKIDLVGSRASLSSQQSTETAPANPASVDVNGSSATFSSDTNEDCTEWVTAIGEDTMMFWRGLKDAGLLDEVMEDLQTEIQEILNGLEERIHEPPLQVKDAALLNNIVQNFGMLDLVKKVLASHKSQMDRCREQYTRSLVALEQQCDEHRKHAKELKSKSQHLNNVLMTLTPVTSPPTSKHPRLTRAFSGPATGAATPAQPTHFTLPITQLAGIPLDKVLSTQTQSPLIGGYTVLTSPGGAELQCDGSNLKVLSTAAVPEGTTGPTIVKVVSPFQLVTLPTVGAGATVQNLAAPVGGAAGNTVVVVPVSTVSTASMETVGLQAEQTAEQSDDQKEKE